LGFEPKMAICDMGYRGHNYKGNCNIQIVNRYRKKIPHSIKKWWKRRSAIEPVIGHMKQEHRLDRNRLKGTFGDEINAVLSGVGFNMRKLLKAILFFCVLNIKTKIRIVLRRSLACFTSSTSLVATCSMVNTASPYCLVYDANQAFSAPTI
jgi:hypothetical protein